MVSHVCYFFGRGNRRLQNKIKSVTHLPEQLPKPLANLFGAEGANAIEAEAEQDAVLFSQTHVEG